MSDSPPSIDTAAGNPGWRRRLLLPRAGGRSLVRAITIFVGTIALAVLVWLWHGTSEPPRAAAQAAVPAAAPLPAGAAPVVDRPEIVFYWRDETGAAYRAAVPKDAYLAYLEAAGATAVRDRKTAAEEASSALRREAVPVFDAVQGRVSQYADWAFDWWTSWILLGRAFGWTWDELRAGHLLTLPDQVQSHLTTAILDRFRTLALQPQVTDPKLAAAADRSWAAADAVVARTCAASRTALADFVKREAHRTERQDPAQGWLPDPAWSPARATVQAVCPPRPAGPFAQGGVHPTLTIADATEPVDDVILRLARPFATKLISFVVLPAIIAAVLGGFILPLFRLLPNVISGIVTGVLTGAFGAAVIGFAASASVDLLLSRTDEALNRPQFEVAARRAVGAAQADFENRVTTAENRVIEAAEHAMLAALRGEAPKRQP